MPPPCPLRLLHRPPFFCLVSLTSPQVWTKTWDSQHAEVPEIARPGSWNDSLGCGRGWVGATVHGMARGAIKTPVWAHATTANPTPPGPWEGAKPKGGGGSLDSEQRHTPRAAHVPLVMCGGLLVGTEVQGADSALATRTCPGRRSEPWWEGDKASGMLRCLITGASAGSRA